MIDQRRMLLDIGASDIDFILDISACFLRLFSLGKSPVKCDDTRIIGNNLRACEK
jgi:hypothetical protein